MDLPFGSLCAARDSFVVDGDVKSGGLRFELRPRPQSQARYGNWRGTNDVPLQDNSACQAGMQLNPTDILNSVPKGQAAHFGCYHIDGDRIDSVSLSVSDTNGSLRVNRTDIVLNRTGDTISVTFDGHHSVSGHPADTFTEHVELEGNKVL